MTGCPVPSKSPTAGELAYGRFDALFGAVRDVLTIALRYTLRLARLSVGATSRGYTSSSWTQRFASPGGRVSVKLAIPVPFPGTLIVFCPSSFAPGDWGWL